MFSIFKGFQVEWVCIQSLKSPATTQATLSGQIFQNSFQEKVFLVDDTDIENAKTPVNHFVFSRTGMNLWLNVMLYTFKLVLCITCQDDDTSRNFPRRKTFYLPTTDNLMGRSSMFTKWFQKKYTTRRMLTVVVGISIHSWFKYIAYQM